MKKILLFLILYMLLPTAFAQEDMQIRFFNIGKADAILITAPDCTVLVDTGTKKGGKTVAEFLQNNGISALDALIITHFDKDHVGGAQNILKSVSVRRVLEPDYFKDSKQTQNYRAALAEQGVSAEVLTENIVFSIGDVRFSVDTANCAYEDENDMSLVVTVECFGRKILLAGDAENPRILELLAENDLQCDILKVPHHGVMENYSPEFFRACHAKYAVITSDDDDLEDDSVTDCLAEIGSTVFLTRQGEVLIHIASDGEIRVEQ